MDALNKAFGIKKQEKLQKFENKQEQKIKLIEQKLADDGSTAQPQVSTPVYESSDVTHNFLKQKIMKSKLKRLK